MVIDGLCGCMPLGGCGLLFCGEGVLWRWLGGA